MDKIRVRFAPSPTGPLHIGGARSALFNYLFVKQNQGDFILRMEDTDLDRSSKESEENIKRSLKWLGIEWNEGIDVGGPHGPYRQTERLEIYQKAVHRLIQEGQAYFCYCSEEECEAERQELIEKGETPRYLGKCRNLTEEEKKKYEQEGRQPVVRFRVPDNHTVTIHDLVRGEVSFETAGMGDYIIVKSDGIPTYNFAVVLDDADMGITHVIRGEEHLSNTPRQILIYDALGLPMPQFAHISLILGKDRSKMSKRHGSTSVVAYQEQGYLPEALVNFLALLGWAPEGEEEIFSMGQLIEKFSLDRVSKSPAVFDMEKLKWINGHYIRNTEPEKLKALAIPYLQEAGFIGAELDADESAWVSLVVETLRNYLSCLEDLKERLEIFMGQTVRFETEEARAILQAEQVPTVVNLFVAKIRDSESVTADSVKGILKQIRKETSLGGSQVFMPIRVALTGQMHGPDLDKLAAILGKEVIIARLRDSAAQIGYAID
ncbi:glutamate--tRNA ligase [Candidatus Formimonas warabiya]|uniref:Glutamate--tRNA ligase n=1 Tax=Formimonas warabiya TaxID=1761012 RepID=A0A3G1KX33_FORW1|nr:glutamate--tRNA ligase [Candidatus Formimonas warabiya]ATW27093.1 glutamate--tRNA ligase [Candidatus Formimonas warabiya]